MGEPSSGRVGGDAEDGYAAGGVFDDEERVEPVPGDRVEVNKSQAMMAWACAWRNWAQVGPDRRADGSMPDACRIFHTVEAPMW